MVSAKDEISASPAHPRAAGIPPAPRPPAGGGREILGRVDRAVDLAREQRGVDLLREQTLSAGLGERPVLDLVAARADDPEFNSLRLPIKRVGEAAARLRLACASASGEPRVPTTQVLTGFRAVLSDIGPLWEPSAALSNPEPWLEPKIYP